MKKGDKVKFGVNFSATTHWNEGEYLGKNEDGEDFVLFNNIIIRANYCKPAKQSVDEYTRKWIYDSGTHLELINDLANKLMQYYNDRKQWENEQ